MTNLLLLSLSIPSNGNGHALGDLLQCRDDPFLGLVRHRPVLGLNGGDICNGQGVGLLTDPVGALMSDHVDRHETAHRAIALRPGTNRDGVLEP